jgi:hypothetical protein
MRKLLPGTLCGTEHSFELVLAVFKGSFKNRKCNTEIYALRFTKNKAPHLTIYMHVADFSGSWWSDHVICGAKKRVH